MKSKSVTHILVSLILLVATTGITVSARYCHNMLVEKSIHISSGPSCDDDNCCSDEATTIRVTADFIVSASQIPVPDAVPDNTAVSAFHESAGTLNTDTEKDKSIHRLRSLSPPLMLQEHSLIQSFLL